MQLHHLSLIFMGIKQMFTFILNFWIGKFVNCELFFTKLSGIDLHENLVCLNLYVWLTVGEFMGKTFQAAQLTHERFLTIDNSCKMFFWYLPNWTSTNLWCVVLYVKHSSTHQRSVEVQFGRYQKMFCRSDLWSKISHVLVVQLKTFSP